MHNLCLSINSVRLSVIPAVLRPESSFFNAFWMPDQVRHDKRTAFMDRL